MSILVRYYYKLFTFKVFEAVDQPIFLLIPVKMLRMKTVGFIVRFNDKKQRIQQQ